MHFLFQRSQQAAFPWHTDGPDLNLSAEMVTAVVNLSTSPSGVQIFGFHTFVFSAVGEVAIFPGDATHRSVRLQPAAIQESQVESEVLKMVAFYD